MIPLVCILIYLALAVVVSVWLQRSARVAHVIFSTIGGSIIGNLAMDNDAVVRIRWTPESKGGKPVPLVDLDPAQTTVTSTDPGLLAVAFDPNDPTIIVATGQGADGNAGLRVDSVNIGDQTPVSGSLPVVLHDPDATQIVFDVVPDAPTP